MNGGRIDMPNLTKILNLPDNDFVAVKRDKFKQLMDLIEALNAENNLLKDEVDELKAKIKH